MTEVIRQHLVPRSYLRNFSIQERSAQKNNKKQRGSQVFSFDKDENKVFKANIENVAVEKYFYDLTSAPPADRQKVEKELGLIESQQSPFINDLLSRVGQIQNLDNNLHSTDLISDVEKEYLSEFVAVQGLRTRKIRNLQNQAKQHPSTVSKKQDLVKSTANNILVANGQNDLNEEVLINGLSQLVDKVVNDEPELQRRLIENRFEEYALKLRNDFIWIFGVNESEMSFYTSDHPVASSLNGLFLPGSEIAFPLSKDLILVVKDKAHYTDDLDKDNKVLKMTEEDVKHYNSLQVKDSNRFVFSSIDNFDLAKQICQENQ
ncbi:hypothetical protein Pse7367_2497 [Thalassoporum mexicanum PCC 7367]|uniref:DUF4238 domain-containing protein n=1 Tax=Thalassoporum mexicanum TaxID=3457544 RepID=UPI00029FB8AB|nr:DUF4238 domain-containing protein [Pseudanabaena sp. PCC 7367]AFY70757.1 hypothetical protein Pse7367_2497 [Pseudanabaena sp. PCC 7367]